MNKSKIELSQEDYWNDKPSPCEICEKEYPATQLSTCDRCGRYACDKCSEAVVNREVNPFKFDFLCEDCIKELTEEKKRERARRKQIMHGLHNTGKLKKKHV